MVRDTVSRDRLIRENSDSSRPGAIELSQVKPEPLYVGRPNIGDRQALYSRIEGMLDRRWLSNDGPLVKELEQTIAQFLGVKHCVAVSNATVGLEIAVKATGLTNRVIVPSYTFIATAHALSWLGITPVFADIDARTHNIDPASLESLITPDTTGILAVHLWGRPCNVDSIAEIANKHSLPVIYDAAHAFGCSRGNRMIGSFGSCEVFSFHATKFINCFEGGAITTEDDDLAEKLRLMRNFGFAGFDTVVSEGTNGKMNEVCAAMGLTSIESIDDLITTNYRNYKAYRERIARFPGISLLEYDESEKNNYQYIVIEVDPVRCSVNRDQLVGALHADNVIARKYFWPGCHRMEPYRSTQPDAGVHLRVSELVSDRVVVLPTGQTISADDIARVCDLIEAALNR